MSKHVGLLDSGIMEASIHDHLYLEVTNRCNLNCEHCSVRQQRVSLHELTFPELSEIITSFWNAGGRYLTLSGGEPTLYPELPELLTLSAEIGFTTTLFTNGVKLDEKVLSTIAASGSLLAISIDGPTSGIHDLLRGSGTHTRALASVNQAVQALGGNRVMISCVLSRPVLIHLQELWDVALSLEVGALYCGLFEPVQHGKLHQWSPEALELTNGVNKLVELAKTSNDQLRLLFSESNDILNIRDAFATRPISHVIGRTIKVQSDGWALPGPFFYNRKFHLGQPLVDGWQKIVASSVFRELETIALKRLKTVPACRECFWSRRCGGGSLALTWAVTGSWSNPCPLCEIYKSVLEKAARERLAHESDINSK